MNSTLKIVFCWIFIALVAVQVEDNSSLGLWSQSGRSSEDPDWLIALARAKGPSFWECHLFYTSSSYKLFVYLLREEASSLLEKPLWQIIQWPWHFRLLQIREKDCLIFFASLQFAMMQEDARRNIDFFIKTNIFVVYLSMSILYFFWKINNLSNFNFMSGIFSAQIPLGCTFVGKLYIHKEYAKSSK